MKELGSARILLTDCVLCDRATIQSFGSRRKAVCRGKLTAELPRRGKTTAAVWRLEWLEFYPLRFWKSPEASSASSTFNHTARVAYTGERWGGRRAGRLHPNGRQLGFGLSGCQTLAQVCRSHQSTKREVARPDCKCDLGVDTAGSQGSKSKAEIEQGSFSNEIRRTAVDMEANEDLGIPCANSSCLGLLPTAEMNASTPASHVPKSQLLTNPAQANSHSLSVTHPSHPLSPTFQSLTPALRCLLSEAITSLSILAALSLALFSSRTTSIVPVPPHNSSSALPAAIARISSSLPHQAPPNPVLHTATLHTPPPTPPPSASPTPATSPSHTSRSTQERSQSAPSTPRPRSSVSTFLASMDPPLPYPNRIRNDMDRPSTSTRSSPIHVSRRPADLPMQSPPNPVLVNNPNNPTDLRYRVSEFDTQRGRTQELLSDFSRLSPFGGDLAVTMAPSTSASLPSSPLARAGAPPGSFSFSLPRGTPPRPPPTVETPAPYAPDMPGPSSKAAPSSESLAFMDDLAGRACQSSPTSMTRVAAVVPGLDEMRPDPLVVFVGVPGRRRKSNTFVKQAADKVGPAVVRLDTERDAPAGDGEMGEDRDRLFRQWFGDSDLQIPRKFRRERGQGSGFVLDGREGTIITNAHVVKGADRVKVTFTDGRVFEGEVTGTDEVTDLALVKVDTRDGGALPKAPLGDSSTVELGDWVIAVGNPFGLDNTISLGIISNLHRTAAEVGIPDKRLDFLQTDCAINPGNSGGPLLNEFGEVIGINTAIRADAEGIAFAIPINNARRIIETLGQGKAVRHPFLGIQMATLTPDLARQYNADPNTGVVIPEMCGVLVVKVSPQSPAALAGLRFGDVVVEVEGNSMRATSQLQKFVEASTVGQTLRMKVRRGERDMELLVRTGDMSPFFGIKKDTRKSQGGATPKSGSGLGSGSEDQNRGFRDPSRSDPGDSLGDQHHHSAPENRPRLFDNRLGQRSEFPSTLPSRSGRGSFGRGDLNFEWERAIPDRADMVRTGWL